jgi:ketosteroid isomerase-like protein
MLLVILFIAVASVAAQTTAFTYQGRLSDGAQTANGSYDLQFALYDSANNQIGEAQIKEDVMVTNGVFNTTLDFGELAFDGSTRTLEISVRRGTETEAFTTLSPRQPITSTPYAIRALNAANADSATNATTAANATSATNATNADKATDAQNLGGVAAANFLQTDGSGANLTNLNALSITTGTLDDARLSANVAFSNSTNTFTGNQTINGDLSQTGTLADLNLTNGFLVRGTVGAGTIPATGAGSRMMFYSSKTAFRTGQVFNDMERYFDGSTFWDDQNVGINSAAFGENNRASGVNSFAAGRNANASGENSLGFNGTASRFGAIALGSGAQATGEDSLALGPGSVSSGLASIVIGPSVARGNFAVAIGLQNSAAGQFSVAIGKNARTCAHYDCPPGSEKQGAIVISDACATFSSDAVTASANNQVNIRGCGGFRFFTNQNLSAGVQIEPGAGAWSSISDRNMKENFQAVNGRDVLQRVLKLPISTWNYKSQDDSIRHIGAMAQDFQAAFAVGESDTMISTIDPDGVAFAAIQGLNAKLDEKTAKTDETVVKLQAENKDLRQQLLIQQTQLVAQQTQFEARLKRLEQSTIVRRKNRRRK